MATYFGYTEEEILRALNEDEYEYTIPSYVLDSYGDDQPDEEEWD